MSDASRQRTIARRLLGGGLFAFWGRVFSSLIAFVIGIILARLLSPESFGSYSLALSVVTLMALIGGLGADQAVVRLVPSADDDSKITFARRGLAIAGVGGLAAGIIIWLGAVKLFQGPIDAPLLAENAFLMALWCLFLVFQRQLSETYRANHNIRNAELFAGMGRTGVLSGSLFLFAVLVAHLFGIMDFRVAVLCTLFSVAATAILAFSFLLRSIRHSGKPMPAVNKTIFAIAIPLGFSALMMTLRGQVDVWLVAATSGTSDTALYTAALRLAVLVLMPTWIVNAVVPPMIAELFKSREISLMESLVRSVATVACIPAFLLCLVLVTGAEPLLRLLYGDFYGDASTMLIFLAIAQFAAVLSGPAAVGMAMTGGERALVGISTMAVIFAIGAGYVAGRLYGPEGVAAISATALILQSIGMACWFRLHLGIWPVATLSPRRLMVLGRHYMPGSQGQGS